PGAEQAGNPALIYNGSTVSVKPVVQARVTTPNNVALPATVDVELLWDGTSQGVATRSTTGLQPGDDFTVAAEVTSPVTTTGRHAWELRVKVTGLSDLVASGVSYVVSQDASPFGTGWNLSIL